MEKNTIIYSINLHEIGDTIALIGQDGASVSAVVVAKYADDPRYQKQEVVDMQAPRFRREINTGQGYFRVRIID